MSAEHTYRFDVKMTCGGCSGAVTKALSKLDGVNSFDVNLESQKVIVKSDTLSLDEVKAKIAKTGKEVRSAEEVPAEESK